MGNNFKVFNSRKQADKQLDILFTKAVISDVHITDDGKYYISWITMKEHYKNTIEAQVDIDKYLEYLHTQFEPVDTRKNIKSDVELEKEEVNQIEPYNEKEVEKEEIKAWLEDMFTNKE